MGQVGTGAWKQQGKERPPRASVDRELRSLSLSQQAGCHHTNRSRGGGEEGTPLTPPSCQSLRPRSTSSIHCGGDPSSILTPHVTHSGSPEHRASASPRPRERRSAVQERRPGGCDPLCGAPSGLVAAHTQDRRFSKYWCEGHTHPLTYDEKYTHFTFKGSSAGSLER